VRVSYADTKTTVRLTEGHELTLQDFCGAIRLRPSPACKPRLRGVYMSQHLSFLSHGKAAGGKARVRTGTWEIRPPGIVGGPGET